MRRSSKHKLAGIRLVLGLILMACVARYIYNRYTRPIYDIYNGPEWDEYRLGDVIKGWMFPRPEDKKYLKNVHIKWPNSIADKYMKRVGYPQSFKNNDMDTLRDIFTDMDHDTPDNDTVVIHVRIGDISSPKTATKVHIKNRVRDIPYYKRMRTLIERYPAIRKVRIIAGAHKNMNQRESSEMLNDVMGVFRDYDTQVVLTHNPDKDFYYMCHSKYFVKSGGGFSNLIEKYVRENGSIAFSEEGMGADERIPI